MRYIILILFLLYGCSTKTEAIKRYSLNPSIKIDRYRASKYKNRSVKIAYPTSIRGLITKKIRYSYNDLEDGSYNNSRWSSSSSKLLMNIFIKAIERSDIFNSVVEYTSLVDTEYLIESEIYEFEHKVRDKSSLAIVSIKFNLVDMSNNSLVKSRKFTYSIPTKTTDARGFVEATNIALSKITIDMLNWLRR